MILILLSLFTSCYGHSIFEFNAFPNYVNVKDFEIVETIPLLNFSIPLLSNTTRMTHQVLIDNVEQARVKIDVSGMYWYAAGLNFVAIYII